MVRARLASLALGSSLLITGCGTFHESNCHNEGWFSRFRLTSRTTAAPCECEGGAPIMNGDGPPMMVPPNAYVPPNVYVPPPGAFPAAPPPIINNVPGATPAPRISPIPQQAPPVPYTPQ